MMHPMFSGEHANCQQAITAALNQSFGMHPDNAELAGVLAPAVYGKTPVQASYIISRMLRGPLASEVPPALRVQFRRAVMRGLRHGRCFKHQGMEIVSFGAGHLPSVWKGEQRPAGISDAAWQAYIEGEGWTPNAAPQVDPNAIINSVFTLLGAGINLAANVADAEASRNMLEAALAAGGATPGTINSLQPSINSASNTIASLAGQASAGTLSQTDFQAAVQAEAERIAAEAQAKQDEGTSPLAVAGIAIGGVTAIALLGFLAAKAFGDRNVHYGAHGMGHPAKFYVSGDATLPLLWSVEVDADNEKAAKEKALDIVDRPGSGVEWSPVQGSGFLDAPTVSMLEAMGRYEVSNVYPDDDVYGEAAGCGCGG